MARLRVIGQLSISILCGARSPDLALDQRWNILPQVGVLIYRALTAPLTTDPPFAGDQIFVYLTWPPQINDHGREHLTVARTGWGTL
jgi:hypothetical protein